MNYGPAARWSFSYWAVACSGWVPRGSHQQSLRYLIHLSIAITILLHSRCIGPIVDRLADSSLASGQQKSFRRCLAAVSPSSNPNIHHFTCPRVHVVGRGHPDAQLENAVTASASASKQRGRNISVVDLTQIHVGRTKKRRTWRERSHESAVGSSAIPWFGYLHGTSFYQRLGVRISLTLCVCRGKPSDNLRQHLRKK